MKTRHTPAGKLYRNDAVYRSAEKLITHADRPPAKRSRVREPLLFATALTLGLLIGFRAWHSPLSPVESPALSENDSPQSPFPARSTFPTTARALELDPPASAPPRDSTEQNRSASESGSPRLSPKAHDATRRPAPATSTPTAATVIHAAASLVSTADLYLYGELRSASESPQAVLLTLRRSNGRSPDPITGVIRFLKDNRPFAGNAVAGAQDGLTLTLRETGPVWVNGDINIIPVGRRFKIAIPLDTGTGEFTGTWSRDDTTGTLHLKAATAR